MIIIAHQSHPFSDLIQFISWMDIPLPYSMISCTLASCRVALVTLSCIISKHAGLMHSPALKSTWVWDIIIAWAQVYSDRNRGIIVVILAKGRGVPLAWEFIYMTEEVIWVTSTVLPHMGLKSVTDAWRVWHVTRPVTVHDIYTDIWVTWYWPQVLCSTPHMTCNRHRSREFSICQIWGVWIPSHCMNMACIHSLGWDTQDINCFLKSIILWWYWAPGKAHNSWVSDADIWSGLNIGGWVVLGPVSWSKLREWRLNQGVWAGASWRNWDWTRELGCGWVNFGLGQFWIKMKWAGV